MAVKTKVKKPAKESPMQKCNQCGELHPANQMFRHWNEKHPAYAQEMRRRGAQSRVKTATKSATQSGGKTGVDELREAAGIKLGKSTHSLVEAAMLEFVGQTIQVPNTPALIYGYFCAKKFGFEGSVGEFLQEVIDDFWENRGINYYKEVMRWEVHGETISPSGQPVVEAQTVAAASLSPSDTEE